MIDRAGGPPGGQKSEDAYRTISEVAADLDLPQHVLRFWETRFPQVKPLKRAGGRRFYRPEDVALLRAVRVLLYDEGYTIKGVQRLLAEHGARHVAEALARSRAAPAPGHEGRRDGGSVTAMSKQDDVGRREPAAPVPGPAAARGPERVPAHPPAPSAAAGPDVADRLSAVLADLAECARLLASVRST